MHIGADGATDDMLDAAVTARAANAAKNYPPALAQIIKKDGVLAELMSRPEMKKAYLVSERIAGNKNQPFKIGIDAERRIIPGKIVDVKGVPLTQKTIKEKQSMYPVRSLHHMKMALDDMTKNPERFGIGASEQDAINSVRGEFLEWLGSKSPAYEGARTAYAADSIPVNQAETLKFLGEKLNAPVTDFGAPSAQRSAMYAQAVRDAPKTVKTATGSQRYESFDEYMTPEQVGKIQDVGADLGRKARHEKLAAAGKPAAASMVAEQPGELAVPPMLDRVAMITRALLSKVKTGAGKRTAATLAEKMQSPEEAALLMELQDNPTALARVIKALSPHAAIAPVMASGRIERNK